MHDDFAVPRDSTTVTAEAAVFFRTAANRFFAGKTSILCSGALRRHEEELRKLYQISRFLA
jgi:hypothetical protein